MTTTINWDYQVKMTVVDHASKVVSRPSPRVLGVCSLDARRLEFGCLMITPRQTPKLCMQYGVCQSHS